jgi:hypothetical protein
MVPTMNCSSKASMSGYSKRFPDATLSRNTSIASALKRRCSAHHGMETSDGRHVATLTRTRKAMWSIHSS